MAEKVKKISKLAAVREIMESNPHATVPELAALLASQHGIEDMRLPQIMAYRALALKGEKKSQKTESNGVPRNRMKRVLKAFAEARTPEGAGETDLHGCYRDVFAAVKKWGPETVCEVARVLCRK